jgi:hypothetical protein
MFVTTKFLVSLIKERLSSNPVSLMKDAVQVDLVIIINDSTLVVMIQHLGHGIKQVVMLAAQMLQRVLLIFAVHNRCLLAHWVIFLQILDPGLLKNIHETEYQRTS